MGTGTTFVMTPRRRSPKIKDATTGAVGRIHPVHRSNNVSSTYEFTTTTKRVGIIGTAKMDVGTKFHACEQIGRVSVQRPLYFISLEASVKSSTLADFILRMADSNLWGQKRDDKLGC